MLRLRRSRVELERVYKNHKIFTYRCIIKPTDVKTISLLPFVSVRIDRDTRPVVVWYDTIITHLLNGSLI